MGLDIYSGEIMPDFFSWAPAKVKFIISPQSAKIAHTAVGGWTQDKRGVFVLPFPYVGSLHINSTTEELEKFRVEISAVCETSLRNIAAKLSEEYVFRYPTPGGKQEFIRIQAGTGSVHKFRTNWMLRLAEVFYNLRRIWDVERPNFRLNEFAFFEAVFLQVRNGYPMSAFVDAIYRDLRGTVERQIRASLLQALLAKAQASSGKQI